MSEELYAKCSCQQCGSHIEFPVEVEGSMVDCPHCHQPTLLTLVAPTPDAAPDALSAADLLAAFTGPVRRTPVTVFYQLGLILVSVLMVILPLVYLALIAAAGYGVYYYAIHFTFLFKFHGGGGRLYMVQVLAYVTPLFVGAVLVFFMIKPLFARRAPRAQPLAMNPALNPALFALIAKICDTVGAPMPKRIDLNCDLNAAAGFRRGWFSLFGDDLVLTIGLPLVAGLNLQQFAGVVAHEFGHFTQGFGMRLSYVIRSVNGWFARVVFERDTWDLWLTQWAEEAENWQLQVVIGCARLGVWFSRLLLHLLMLIGHGVSCFLLRQMEYDADSYEIKLAGSETFEASVKRLRVLAEALDRSYKDMRITWNKNQRLPDDFPAFLLQHEAAMPPERRTRIEDRVGLVTSGLFDTHPADGDRIRRARMAGEPGVFHLEQPATLLFASFEAVARQVTFLHYTDDIGLYCEPANLQPLNPVAPLES